MTGGFSKAFSRHSNSPPDPKVRPCWSCGIEVELNDNWECPTPGCQRWDGKPTQVFRTFITLDCQDCGRRRGALYVYNSLELLNCVCSKSVEQLAREKFEADREALIKAQRHQQLKEAAIARDCWTNKMKRDCGITTLRPYCKTCYRFGGKYQGLLAQYERGAK